MGRRRWLFALMGLFSCALIAVGGWLAYSIVHPSTGAPAYQTVLTPGQALREVAVSGSSILARRTSTDAASPLLLFFPATGARTSVYGSFLNTAVSDGYHVIALPYANRRTERSQCQSDAACYGQIRAEQLNGVESAYLPHAAAQASVQATLPGVLRQLTERDPHGNWNSYLSADSIDWSKVVVAGHSQGGGLAAYVGHQKAVRGVIMFSSPNDVWLRTATLASWLKSPSATQEHRYFGFVDTHDFYAATTRAAWQAMLPGTAIVCADGNNTFSGQLLTTSAAHFPSGLGTHFAVVRDTVYAPVWRYLLDQARTAARP